MSNLNRLNFKDAINTGVVVPFAKFPKNTVWKEGSPSILNVTNSLRKVKV